MMVDGALDKAWDEKEESHAVSRVTMEQNSNRGHVERSRSESQGTISRGFWDYDVHSCSARVGIRVHKDSGEIRAHAAQPRVTHVSREI